MLAFSPENPAAGTALVTGHILTSPDVPFFRNEELDLLAAPYPVTVITAAAPDLGWLLANTMDNSESKDRFDDVAGVFARRTQYVFAAAQRAGCDVVVVGPWGCGAFGNDAEVVAEAFVAAVSRYRDAFDEIVFSTWGPAQNREALEKRFADNGLWR